MKEIVEILKNEIFIGYLEIVIEAIFLFFVWLEFKYIKKEQQEKRDKEANRQLNAIVGIFLRLYRWKACENWIEREVLRDKHERAMRNYITAIESPSLAIKSISFLGCRELVMLFANEDENGLKKKLDELPNNNDNSWARAIIGDLLESLDILKNYKDKMDALWKEMNKENMSNFLLNEYITRIRKTNASKKEQATVKEIIKIVINIRPPFKIHDCNDLEKWDNHINAIHLPVEYTKSMRKYYKMLDLIYNKIYYLDIKRQ